MNQAAFSPSGRRLFTLGGRQLAFFTLNPFTDTGKRYALDARYAEPVWASDDTVRIADTRKAGSQLVDAASGAKKYDCSYCKNLQLSSQHDLIELYDASIRFKPKKGDGWEAGVDLKNSSDLDAMSLRGGKLVGIHANQFRIWDLANPNEEPQIVRTSDKLWLAQAFLIPGYYVTISETRELNLWPVKDPSHYNSSAKLAPVYAVLPLANGEGAVIVGNEWVHVLKRSTTGRFEFSNHPINGTVLSYTVRSLQDGIRMSVRRGSGTFITPLLKPDLSDLAPLPPPAGKTWADVLNTWTERLNLNVNSQGMVSAAHTVN